MSINKNFEAVLRLTWSITKTSIRRQFGEIDGVQPNLMCIEIKEKMILTGSFFLKMEAENVKS